MVVLGRPPSPSFSVTTGVVYLERDINTRDQYGCDPAYVWFEVAGLPYMLNHVLVTNGWAEDIDYGDRKYDSQLRTSVAFAEEHQLGVYALSGDFGIPAARPTPAPAPIASTPEPLVPDSAPAPPEPEQSGCDPNYTPCVPLVSSDLDCADIGHSVTAIGSNPHGFDGNDNDGLGCESW